MTLSDEIRNGYKEKFLCQNSCKVYLYFLSNVIDFDVKLCCFHLLLISAASLTFEYP